MDEWVLQVVQFVWFKDDLSGITAPRTYEALFGEAADNTSTNRSLSPAAPFLSQAVTNGADRIQQVLVAPGRVDLIVAHPDRPQSGPWGWKLADGLKILDQMSERAIKHTDQIGETNRLAVLLTLIRNVTTANAAATFVLERVKAELPASSLDLMFQVNIRKMLPGNVLANRLVRFNTASVQDMSLTIAGGAPMSTIMGPERHIAGMQIDVNLVPTGKRHLAESAKALFLELVGEAKLLAKDGTLEGLTGQHE